MTIQGSELDPTTRAFMCASKITRSVGNQCISASPGSASAAVVNSMDFAVSVKHQEERALSY